MRSNTLLERRTAAGWLWDSDEKAAEMWDRCLKGHLATLGLVHTDTLSTMRNLGAVYARMEKRKKGLVLLERALKGMERTLGKSHPMTIAALENLAEIHELGSGTFAERECLEAEGYYERALRGCIAHFGKDHLRSKKTLYNLNRCISNAGGDIARMQRRKREIATDYQGIEEVGGFFSWVKEVFSKNY